MNCLRHLFAWILGRRVVVLEDIDGELNTRIERRNALGNPSAIRFAFVRDVRLLDDGKIAGAPYVMRWHLIADYRRHDSRKGEA